MEQKDCPRCGTRLRLSGLEKELSCSSCGFVDYKQDNYFSEKGVGIKVYPKTIRGLIRSFAYANDMSMGSYIEKIGLTRNDLNSLSSVERVLKIIIKNFNISRSDLFQLLMVGNENEIEKKKQPQVSRSKVKN